MKILSIYYTHKPGGFCKRLYRLLNAIADRGHEVRYLSLDPPPNKLSKGVSFTRIPFPLSTRKGLLFWGLFLLIAPVYTLKASRAFKPDRFVVFGSFYSSIVSLAKKFVGAPIILFVRIVVFDADEKKRLYPNFARAAARKIYKRGLEQADTLVFMTKAMQTRLESLLQTKFNNVKILPNDSPRVDKEKHADYSLPDLNLPNNARVILTSGAFNKVKNIRLLINAFNGIKENEGVYLVVAGSGETLSDLKEYAQKLGTQRIIFTGWLDSLAPLYKSAFLYVHPSFGEGMPNSVLEALAWGVPVLTSDTPEHKEMILHEELLFNPHEAQMLRKKLQKALADTEYYETLKQLSKERCQSLSFDWEQEAELICLMEA